MCCENSACPWLARPSHVGIPWEPPPEWQGTAFAQRRSFFEQHPEHCNGHVTCPVCGYPTLRARNDYDYCSLCHWEDDGQDDPWADYSNGGPNSGTLSAVRRHFEQTLCMYGWDEANDFHRTNWARLFSRLAQREKRKLCALYDALMDLHDPEAIAMQWQKIDRQWLFVP